MSSSKTETLSLFDIPKIYFEKDFDETEEGDLVYLQHKIRNEEKEIMVSLEFYKRFIYCPNKKDTSVFDRERFYHPGMLMFIHSMDLYPIQLTKKKKQRMLLKVMENIKLQ